MRLAELIADYRDRADDHAPPYRADDPTVTRWLNEAIAEACVRARLRFDAASAMCTIRIEPDQATYPLAPEIDTISAAWTDKYRTPLEATDQSALDRAGNPYPVPHYRGRRGGTYYARSEYWSQWRTQKGHPWHYLRDGQQIRLVPIPKDADTLRLEVYRTPTAAERMREPNDRPTIAPVHHSGLVDWALYRAYLRRDEDQHDPKLAATHLALFEARFGARADANVVRRRQEHRSCVTTINWP